MQAYQLPEVVAIGEEEQARLAEVVDATVREAQRAAARSLVEAVARLVKGLPRGECAMLHLGVSEEAVGAIAALGSQQPPYVYEDGTAQDVARAEVDGLVVLVRGPVRDATPSELLDRERRVEESERPSGMPVEVLS